MAFHLAESENEFAKDLILTLNENRKKHLSPAVKVDAGLTKAAKAWATYLGKLKKLRYSPKYRKSESELFYMHCLDYRK